jgi:hypothetical protein
MTTAVGPSPISPPADAIVGTAPIAFRGTAPAIRNQQHQIQEARAVGELQGIARFKFQEGMLEEFKRLSAQAVEIVRAQDTGTLQFEIYFSEDQSECVVLERYKDSEALIQHAMHLGDLSGAILATGFVSGELLGEPSAELKANLADGPVRLFTPYVSI